MKKRSSKYLKAPVLTNEINLISLSLIISTTLVTAAIILQYCESFLLLGNIAKDRLINSPILAFFVTPIFFWISAFLCRKFSQNSAGNTIQSIESSLALSGENQNYEKDLKKSFSLRSIIVNISSSLLSTFGGGALGREAPSVYISTGIFVVIGSKLKKFLPTKIIIKAWLCSGIVVGFAVAFHAPIAGFIYLIEKLIKTKQRDFLDNILISTTALFAVIIALNQTKPLFATYGVSLNFGFEIFLIALVVVICGISSFFLKDTSLFFYEKATAIKSRKWHLIPIAAGFAVSILSIYGGVNSFSGGIKTAQNIIAGTNLGTVETSARIMNTFLTFISGCAGGLVAPAIAIGASIGSIFSEMMTSVDPKIFILGGMTSFLSPVLMTPFATAMAIAETCDQPISALPFLLCASFTSFFVAKIIDKIRVK